MRLCGTGRRAASIPTRTGRTRTLSAGFAGGRGRGRTPPPAARDPIAGAPETARAAGFRANGIESSLFTGPGIIRLRRKRFSFKGDVAIGRVRIHPGEPVARVLVHVSPNEEKESEVTHLTHVRELVSEQSLRDRR